MGCVKSKEQIKFGSQQKSVQARTLKVQSQIPLQSQISLNKTSKSINTNQNHYQNQALNPIKKGNQKSSIQTNLQSALMINSDSSYPSKISSIDKACYLHRSRTQSKICQCVAENLNQQDYKTGFPSKTHTNDANIPQSIIDINRNSLTAPHKTQD